MSVCLTSFSTPDYKPYLNKLIKSARKFGIKKTLIYGINDLTKAEFYRKHYTTFQQKTGFGYWLWKPFFVNKALSEIKYGDVLFYVDAASLFIADPGPLVNIALTNESGIVAFDAWPMQNRQWTKRDTFINMNCDDQRFWDAKHVIATLFLIRKTDFTVDFFSEWLKECENVQSLSDNPNVHEKENFSDFVSHRMDQSILSILIKKYAVETYRNPSKWGNFLKVKEVRMPEEHISSPYALPPYIYDYAEDAYLNSPYGTIMEFNRRVPHKTDKKSMKRIIGLKIKNFFRI